MNEKLYFEDLTPGQVFELGTTAPITEAEIIEFAKLYDPQPIHVDPQAAEAGFFKGIIASGWHTVGLCMRLLVDTLVNKANTIASPGVENLAWVKPVRPGDTLTARLTVIELIPSKSRPEIGTVKYIMEAFNQAGEQVLKMSGPYLYYRRPQ